VHFQNGGPVRVGQQASEPFAGTSRRFRFDFQQAVKRQRQFVWAIAVTFAFIASHLDAQDAAPQFADVAARAAAARDQGNLPQAIDLYNQAEQLKPDWAEGWFYLGMLQYSADSYQPAIEAFNRLLQVDPHAIPGMALRGLCEFETGAYDAALRDLDEAVAKGAANQPRNEQILRYHLAQLLTRAGRFQDAQTQYGFFAAEGVSNPDLLVGLGLAGMRVPLLTQEVPAADRALYQTIGEAGFALLAGQTQEADAAFRALFAEHPTAPGLHFFYGFLLFPHSPELAADQFKSEVALAPSNVEAHAMLAFTLMINGTYQEAATEAALTLAKTPDMELAQIALGRSLAETGNVARGTEILTQVLKTDPDNLEAHLGMAAIYSRTGRREDAYREHMLCLGLAK
jgi:tetratricopeptide (TPR) repeat protein